MTYAEFFAEFKGKFAGADVSDINEHLAFQFNNCDEECGDEWEENPFALPIITSKELKSYGNNPFNETPFGCIFVHRAENMSNYPNALPVYNRWANRAAVLLPPRR